MAPLGWSGGSQFSSTVLPIGSPVVVSMRGGVGAACGRGRISNCDELAFNYDEVTWEWFAHLYDSMDCEGKRHVIYCGSGWPRSNYWSCTQYVVLTFLKGWSIHIPLTPHHFPLLPHSTLPLHYWLMHHLWTTLWSCRLFLVPDHSVWHYWPFPQPSHDTVESPLEEFQGPVFDSSHSIL